MKVATGIGVAKKKSTANHPSCQIGKSADNLLNRLMLSTDIRISGNRRIRGEWV
jgi:hypothetical protein